MSSVFTTARGEFSKLDESRISNPKSDVSNWTPCGLRSPVQSEISAFGFEILNSSNFEILYGRAAPASDDSLAGAGSSLAYLLQVLQFFTDAPGPVACL